MKEKRSSFPDDILAGQSKEIRERLLETELYRKSRIIFTYVSFAKETDTRGIIYQAWKDGKKVYAPKVTGKELVFYEINDFASLIRSRFGVPEPSENLHREFVWRESGNRELGQSLLLKEDIVSDRVPMLLPGLAFDRGGNRIGYGAGYYDRYLKAHGSKFINVALAYDFQIIDTIVAEPHDWKVDYIITPGFMVNCGAI